MYFYKLTYVYSMLYLSLDLSCQTSGDKAMIDSTNLNGEEFDEEVRKAALGARSTEEMERRIMDHFYPTPNVCVRESGTQGFFTAIIFPYRGKGESCVVRYLR